MQIKSTFTDYYDWVSSVDPVFGDIVYDRSHISKPSYVPSRDIGFYHGTNWTEKYIAIKKKTLIRGKSYFAYRSIPQFVTVVVSDTIYYFTKVNERWSLYYSETSDNILKMSREVGKPVYFVAEQVIGIPQIEQQYLLIPRIVPKLSEYGFPAFITAENMYNTIDYFVRNLVHEVPDGSITDTMASSEKLLSHGFDPKQSFRHRK